MAKPRFLSRPLLIYARDSLVLIETSLNQARVESVTLVQRLKRAVVPSPTARFLSH